MSTEVVNEDVRVQLGDDVFHLTLGDFGLVTLGAMAYWIGLLVVVQGITGATLGKAILAIRTVDANGRPGGVGRAAVRWVLLVVDGFFYLFPVVGLITALASDGNRRVGDLAAGTFVIRRSAVGEPITVGAPAAGPPTESHWDPKLEAYVCWEPRQRIWLRWDAQANRWEPLAPDPRS